MHHLLIQNGRRVMDVVKMGYIFKCFDYIRLRCSYLMLTKYHCCVSDAF